tara:strand:+ start:1461 stop:1658 length:198 start_codon:yes stop_codon:yes gene_type:complete
MGFKLGDLVFFVGGRWDNRTGPGVIVWVEKCEPDECGIQVMWPIHGLNWECPSDLISAEMVERHG